MREEPTAAARCAAYGCCEPPQTAYCDLCVRHQRLAWDFCQWLNGLSSRWESLDISRAEWEQRARRV